MFFIIILSLNHIGIHAQVITLSPQSNFPNGHRLGGFTFSIGNYGYIGGGFATFTVGGNVDELWRYDPITDTWTQLASVPDSVLDCSYFVINNLGYVVGGSGSNATYEYNPGSNSWASKAPYPGPVVTAGIGVALNGLGYVGSGKYINQTYSNAFYAFDPAANIWIQKANIPNPGIYQFAFVNGSEIFCGGGFQPNGDLCFQYNPNSDTWIQKNDFPFGIEYPIDTVMFFGAVPFVLNSEMYLIGGTAAQNPSGFHIFKYNSSSDSWSITFSWNPTQPPYYNLSLCQPFVMQINGVPYFTMGYDPSNIYYNETFSISSTTGLIHSPSNPIVSCTVINNTSLQITSNLQLDGQLIIFDLHGNIVLNSMMDSDTFIVDLGNLTSTLYIIQIKSSNQIVFTEKIVFLK